MSPDFKAGDRVFGITAGEAQAELLKIDHRLLTKIPHNLTFTEAAAVPEAFITAHDAVFTQGDLKGEETLLVHAVGSGVGLAALQLGKVFGHRVLGTSRTQRSWTAVANLVSTMGSSLDPTRSLQMKF
jgi:NADPH:quinone reductase-like Zn-dependent oxidoreductase